MNKQPSDPLHQLACANFQCLFLYVKAIKDCSVAPCYFQWWVTVVYCSLITDKFYFTEWRC